MKQKIITIDKREVEIELLPHTRFLQIKEAWSEAVRLTKLRFSKRRWDNHSAIWSTKLLTFTDGSQITIPTDLADRVFVFLEDFFHTIGNFSFKYAKCTHPHECVYQDIEGDEDYGFAKQTLCSKCGTYVDKDDVDRYRPDEHRKPDDISPPIYYPRGYLACGGKPHVNIEVGRTYETRDHSVVEIIDQIDEIDHESGADWKFKDSCGNVYTETGGRQRFHAHPGDIIREKNPFTNKFRMV